jgi:hypothetical protein
MWLAVSEFTPLICPVPKTLTHRDLAFIGLGDDGLEMVGICLFGCVVGDGVRETAPGLISAGIAPPTAGQTTGNAANETPASGPPVGITHLQITLRHEKNCLNPP